jgi:DNA-binding PadR family transcriptional regulator
MGNFGHKGPHAPPWFFEFFGPPPRAEKGELRYLIMDAIKDQARHGYEIIQTIESRSQGRYRPSPGAVYPTLQMLQEMGHASSREDQGRTLYVLTDAGKQELHAHNDEVEDAYERLGFDFDWVDVDDVRELGARLRRLGRTVKRAFRHGKLGRSSFAEVLTIVDEAIDRIEALLTKR